MNSSHTDPREVANPDSAQIPHPLVDETAGDEGIDDPQADDTGTPAASPLIQ